MTADLHRWARLFAAFAIVLGIAYPLLASASDPAGQMADFRADLLWPALVLSAAAAMGLIAVRQQLRGRGE